MIFETFKPEHVAQAAQLSQADYDRACQHVSSLQPTDFRSYFTKQLLGLCDRGFGIVALDEQNRDQVLGFIATYPPSNSLFGRCKGVFSPLYAHSTVPDNREKIYTKLYTELATQLVQQGITSHCLSLYDHDHKGVSCFFQNGFGMRCVDGITSLVTYAEPATTKTEGLVVRELGIDEIHKLLPFMEDLHTHLGMSPTFMPTSPISLETQKKETLAENLRYFGLYLEGQLIGYTQVGNYGETFINEDPLTLHVNGAYLNPTYRGQGYYHYLLHTVLHILKTEGYTHCGVDYESINPAANNFWPKFFTPYTKGLVRRIDERIISFYKEEREE